MAEYLPPLTALRAFDAAARHMSFARAADELSVTPSALSLQIKSLEQHLQAPLFHRLNREVRLTEAGRILAPGAQEAFSGLAHAWRAARRSVETNVLNVTAGPAFTAKILAPKLYEFARSHPKTELRLVASLRMMDFERDEIDVAIRFGASTWPDLYSHNLSNEWLTPVMTPALAARYSSPETLSKAPLLFDQSIDFLSPRCDWAAWFNAAGLGCAPSFGTRFSNADHAIEAALAGAGITLGRISLVSSDLQAGRLVAPFKIGISTRARFLFLCQKGYEDRASVIAFRDWIAHETAIAPSLSKGFNIIPVEAVQ